MANFSLLHYFTSPYQSDTLYHREKVKVLVGSCLLIMPSITIGLVIHLLDQKPLTVLLADITFFLSAALGLYFVKVKRPTTAGNLLLGSLILLTFTHSILTDYLYEHELTFYRITETTLLLILALLTVVFLMQKFYQVISVAIFGLVIISLHYVVVTLKTGVAPLAIHPLSILIGYLLVFGVCCIISYYMLYSFTHLIRKVEEESQKVKKYNTELEERVAERTEALESQNQTMKKINNELDRFVYRASHDLRAPLTSILGLIQLARLEDNLDKVRDYLSLKEKSVKKLDHFIQEIVHISKNARTEVVHDKIDFKAMIEDVLDHLSYMENAPLIEQQIEVSQQSSFFSDSHRLRVILNNLLSNAIRYAAPHRRSSYIKISVYIDEAMASIEIEDNGLGIAEAYLHKVFDMFFRANQDSTGSGLGLYIVKETLEKLRGDISVVSTLGKGTIFTVVLPNKIPCHLLKTVSSS